ncbi:MFS transporter [Deinococcus radiopugnans]|uniref:MFS family permease n=1 Tax=Deinococcus radiopugnans ATCC 19172 TaxID=585398 RepID=A0A5C4Y990_9DEIO|nr:MFS transporter [Deinococcus radiopugnans]MBB6015783.1 MFS family permease [Deinococcus radiopugnans ATCC 19172]TNM72535.1 MFS transporter [Deinococcus radiopugnans ATCC 19172]
MIRTTAPLPTPAAPAAAEGVSPLTPPDTLTRLTLLLLAALTIMSGATISPALPAMTVHFADHPNAALLVKLSLTIVGLAIAVSAPVGGLLVDRFGRRPVLLVSLLLYALGGASGLVAPSLDALLAGRVVLGLAVAGTMTAGGALVNDYFAGAARGRFLSQQASFTSFGGAVLLPLGGLLAGVGWRAPFGLYLVSLLLLPLVLRLPRGIPGPAQIDGPEDRPRWGTISVIYVLALAYMAVFYLMPAQGPFLLKFLGASPASTGLLLGAFTLTAALTALGYSRFSGRFDHRRVAALGLLLLAAGWGVVAAGSSVAGVLPGLIVAGMGGGLALPNLNAWLAELTPRAWRGRIVAGMSSAIFLGQFLSPLLLAAPSDHPAQGFVWGALAIGGIGAALLALSTWGGQSRAARSA